MTISIFDKWVHTHREYSYAQHRLKTETDMMLEGNGPFILPLYGESGAGKSALLEDYLACYKTLLSDKGRPVVHSVRMPTKQAGKSLPERVFQSLNHNAIVRCTEAAMRDKAINAMLKGGIKVLVIEELNNMAESTASLNALTNQAVQLSNWFKEIFDTNEISLVLGGLPSIKVLFQANPQLERRSLRAAEIPAYQWSIAADKEEYTKVIKAFVKRLHDAGWTIQADPALIIRASYIASSGLVGITRDLFAGVEKVGVESKCLNTELLASNFDRQFQRKDLGNPFRLEKISDELLAKAYTNARVRADIFTHRIKRGGNR